MFLICAVFGGTILLCQTVLTMIGLVGDSTDVDVAHDVGHDFGGDVHGDAGVDLHVETADALHPGHGVEHAESGHGTVWLFKILSFRTLVAAVTFFGIAGMAGDSAGLEPLWSLAIALAAGLAAMYAVFLMMRTLYRLGSEGTVRIDRAVGLLGTVYLRVPPERSGAGKVTLNLQNRTMEYSAMTAGPGLPTGARVVVLGVIGPDTLDVQAAPEPDAEQPASERNLYA
jgi:hypothetical protein